MPIPELSRPDARRGVSVCRPRHPRQQFVDTGHRLFQVTLGRQLHPEVPKAPTRISRRPRWLSQTPEITVALMPVGVVEGEVIPAASWSPGQSGP